MFNILLCSLGKKRNVYREAEFSAVLDWWFKKRHTKNWCLQFISFKWSNYANKIRDLRYWVLTVPNGIMTEDGNRTVRLTVASKYIFKCNRIHSTFFSFIRSFTNFKFDCVRLACLKYYYYNNSHLSTDLHTHTRAHGTTA